MPYSIVVYLDYYRSITVDNWVFSYCGWDIFAEIYGKEIVDYIY